MEKQPARINYFFGPGWHSLGETIKGAFVNLGKIEHSIFSRFVNIWENVGNHFNIGLVISSLIRTVAYIIQALVTSILAVAIVLVCTIIHALIVTIFMGLVYVGFTFVWLADYIYRKMHGIISHCSNCQRRIELPQYRCSCGRVHTKLVPSKYGILKRTCDCGRELPTTFFNGRQKLNAICPHCKFDLTNGGAHVAVTFPLIGGPSSGKTCFINMSIYSLSKNAAKLNYNFEYEDEGSMEYENNIQGIENGAFPAKTNNMALTFYRFNWSKEKQTIQNEISLCDIGGEAYADKETLKKQIGYANSQGYIVIIDPLAIKEYRREIEKKHDISSFNGSTMSLDEVLDMLVSTVDGLTNSDSKDKITTDCAVVFTKLDLPGLDEKIGDAAIEEYRAGGKISFLQAQNAVCENFLREYGEDNFTNTLKAKFKNVQFFACTALADDGSGKLYSKNAARALAWLMNGKGKGISFEENEIISLVD